MTDSSEMLHSLCQFVLAPSPSFSECQQYFLPCPFVDTSWSGWRGRGGSHGAAEPDSGDTPAVLEDVGRREQTGVPRGLDSKGL